MTSFAGGTAVVFGWFLASFFPPSPPFFSVPFFLFFQCLCRHGRFRQFHLLKIKAKRIHAVFTDGLFFGIFRRQHFCLGYIPIVHGHHAPLQRQNEAFLEAHAATVGNFDLDGRDFVAVEQVAHLGLGFLGFLVGQWRRRGRRGYGRSR